MISKYWSEFEDFPRNPLIGPPPFEWIIADPTALAPSQTPDGKWHLWAHSLRGIHHYISNDGYDWQKQGGPLFGGIRPCVRREGDKYYLFYEKFLGLRRSIIEARSSSDLVDWSAPVNLLEPEYEWETGFWHYNGNPCLLKGPFGYRLYYSASAVFLTDCLFPEPKYIGVAESDSILGPYRKKPKPIISPSPATPYRNFGAGAIKVYMDEGKFIGLNNGIYKDNRGRSRSAILLLESEDGFDFRPVQEEPIIAPEPHTWKRAFVYALEVVRHENELRLYYNARNGWFIGKERLGVANVKIT